MVKLISKLRFLFLFILLILFVLFKAIDDIYYLWGVADSLILILMLFSILIIGDKRKGMLLLLLLPVTAELFFYILGSYFSPSVVQIISYSIASIFMVFMTVVCLSFTFADEQITVTTLFGSLSAYMFMGLAFAYLYIVLGAYTPGAFNGLRTGQESHAIYYSFVTLTTLGFGDVLPTGAIAQTFSWLEALLGQGYLAIVMAQLVARFVAEHMGKNP